MRLDAQVKLAEKSAKPMWLYAVLGLLIVGVGVGGYMFYQYTERTAAEAEQQRIAQEAERKKRDEEFAAIAKELKGLQEEQSRIRSQKDDIENQLKNVKDESEKQRLLAEKAALDQQLAASDEKIKKNKGKTTAKSGGSDEPKTEKPKGGITVKKNVDDPLDGL